MDIKSAMGTIGKKASEIGDAALNGVLAGVNQLEYRTDILGDKVGSKLYSKTADMMMSEGFQGISGKVVGATNRNAFRIGRTIGGGAEGLIAGAAGGAVIGGISGGIDSDESFLGGMGKGALAGAGIGFAAGATSAYVHNNSGLLSNAFDDSSAIAARIATLKGAAGESINNMKSKFGR